MTTTANSGWESDEYLDEDALLGGSDDDALEQEDEFVLDAVAPELDDDLNITQPSHNDSQNSQFDQSQYEHGYNNNNSQICQDDSLAEEPEEEVERVVMEQDDDDEEEEDEDFSGRRGRFISERRVDQVIPKSSAPRENIPDSLELAPEQAAEIDKFMTDQQNQRNQKNQRRRGGGHFNRGRGMRGGPRPPFNQRGPPPGQMMHPGPNPMQMGGHRMMMRPGFNPPQFHGGGHPNQFHTHMQPVPGGPLHPPGPQPIPTLSGTLRTVPLMEMEEPLVVPGEEPPMNFQPAPGPAHIPQQQRPLPQQQRPPLQQPQTLLQNPYPGVPPRPKKILINPHFRPRTAPAPQPVLQPPMQQPNGPPLGVNFQPTPPTSWAPTSQPMPVFPGNGQPMQQQRPTTMAQQQHVMQNRLAPPGVMIRPNQGIRPQGRQIHQGPPQDFNNQQVRGPPNAPQPRPQGQMQRPQGQMLRPQGQKQGKASGVQWQGGGGAPPKQLQHFGGAPQMEEEPMEENYQNVPPPKQLQQQRKQPKRFKAICYKYRDHGICNNQHCNFSHDEQDIQAFAEWEQQNNTNIIDDFNNQSQIAMNKGSNVIEVQTVNLPNTRTRGLNPQAGAQKRRSGDGMGGQPQTAPFIPLGEDEPQPKQSRLKPPPGDRLKPPPCATKTPAGKTTIISTIKPTSNPSMENALDDDLARRLQMQSEQRELVKKQKEMSRNIAILKKAQETGVELEEGAIAAPPVPTNPARQVKAPIQKINMGNGGQQSNVVKLKKTKIQAISAPAGGPVQQNKTIRPMGNHDEQIDYQHQHVQQGMPPQRGNARGRGRGQGVMRQNSNQQQQMMQQQGQPPQQQQMVQRGRGGQRGRGARVNHHQDTIANRTATVGAPPTIQQARGRGGTVRGRGGKYPIEQGHGNRMVVPPQGQAIAVQQMQPAPNQRRLVLTEESQQRKLQGKAKISGISFTTRQSKLMEMAEQCGPVTSFVYHPENLTADVQFEIPQHAIDFRQKFNRHMLDAHNIFITCL